MQSSVCKDVAKICSVPVSTSRAQYIIAPPGNPRAAAPEIAPKTPGGLFLRPVRSPYLKESTLRELRGLARKMVARDSRLFLRIRRRCKTSSLQHSWVKPIPDRRSREILGRYTIYADVARSRNTICYPARFRAGPFFSQLLAKRDRARVRARRRRGYVLRALTRSANNEVNLSSFRRPRAASSSAGENIVGRPGWTRS